MPTIKYSKEEATVIKNAYDNVLDVLDDLWSLSEYEQISVSLSMNGIDKVKKEYPHWDWFLVLNDHGIFLESRFRSEPTRIILEQKTMINKKRKYDLGVIEIFLKEFEKAKEKVEIQVKQGKIEKQKSLEGFALLEQKYAKEARVEIELPDTMNQHTLEIKQENGQTVGKLNFESSIIKIITRGSITVDKQEDYPYVKRK